MIEVYTKNNCIACTRTKKRLEQNGIPFIEINVEDNPQEADKLRAEGWKQMPVVKTPQRAWSGFNLEELQRVKSLYK